MSVTIRTYFESAVTEADKDTFVGTYIEEKKSMIESDMRKRNWQQVLKTDSEIYWSGKTYTVDVYEFSTFHCQIVYRFIMARGYYFTTGSNREYFTPEPSEVSTHHHMSKNIIRLACFLAVMCGVTLRNIATIFSELFQVPATKSCMNRWMNEIGSELSEEDILKKMIESKKPTECHIDAYYPMGTDRCVMVIKDDYDRILITHEADSENAEDAKIILQKVKDAGINMAYVFSDHSESFTSAIREIFPGAKFQADHFHTVRNIRKHSKKALLEYRREIKANGEKENDCELIDIAKELWKLRWSLLKKPSNMSKEEREEIEKIEERDGGFIKKFRSVIRQIVNIFDYSNTETQAKIKLKNLKTQVENTGNVHLKKICGFFDDHWEKAMQYLKKRGLGKHERSSDSESGMRILRRLEKNHDGIRSEIARKNYMKIYQSVKYLSEDVTDFLNPFHV